LRRHFQFPKPVVLQVIQARVLELKIQRYRLGEVWHLFRHRLYKFQIGHLLQELLSDLLDQFLNLLAAVLQHHVVELLVVCKVRLLHPK